VSAWAVRIAKTMGLDQATIEEARVAGLLHDVGKTEVSVMLLRKSASLSAEERAQIGTHVTRGAEILGSVGGMLAHVADAVEMHHEKFDGSGYKKLKGEQIPLLARIVAGADSFDAMVSDRPYRKGMALVEARDTLVAASGTHFDPNVVAALKTIVDNDWDAAGGPAAEGWPQPSVAAPSR
jgi:putative nucleotidyltransferase with HDIG domain